MIGTLRRLTGDRRAAAAVEYGLIVALIVLAVLASLRAMAGETTTMWNNVSDKVSKAN